MVFTRYFLQRAIAFIYFLGFLILINQICPLIGEQGLLPANLFIQKIKFWQSPSLFWFHFSDSSLLFGAYLGLILSILALSGVSDDHGFSLSMLVWGLLWLLYLSFVNIGQDFYSFGWETLLLETGFLAIFLGPKRSSPSKIIIWAYRWILFRLMFGAGLIKIRGDACWTDLTCMDYHYETQPIPNPLSWYFHYLPQPVHKLSVLFTHFMELIVPFFYFAPNRIRKIRLAAGLLTVIFQIIIILSGNLAWLNYITIVLSISCFDDQFLKSLTPKKFYFPATFRNPIPRKIALYGLAILLSILSIKPAINLFSTSQVMNGSFDVLHLVNTYGAFGSVTKVRREIIIEGTSEKILSPQTKWLAYEFKGKPGDVNHWPPLISPYHLRLDWHMWFAAMASFQQYPWLLNLVSKLLQGHLPLLGLLRINPFQDHPPLHVRMQLYEYHFSPFKVAWERKYLGPYLPPLSLENPQFRQILKDQGW